jgi:hypothetical protein
MVARFRHRGRPWAERILLWLKIGYGAAVPVIVVIYWRNYGPSNFLWLSDIALFCTTLSLFTGSRLLASMPAVGVLPLEIAWLIDFLSGGRLLGLTSYMFDPKLPLYLRSLSLFHLALPPTLIFLLYRFGYDRRALIYQTLVTWAALLLAYLATEPEKNINWAFGPGNEPQQTLPPLLYLSLEMVALPLLVIVPMHLIVSRLFDRNADRK